MDDTGKQPPKDDAEEYQDYLGERKRLVEGGHQASRDIDKGLLTMSGGALGLSITFLTKLPEGTVAVAGWLLVVGWIGFSGSIIQTLLSYWFSIKVHRRFVEELDVVIASDATRGALNRARIEQKKVKETWYVSWLNLGSLICFAVGMVFTAWFAFKNF